MTKTKLATLTTIPLFILGSSAIAGLTFGTIVNTINHGSEQTNGRESLRDVIGVTNFVPSNGNCNFTGIPDEKSILALVKKNNPNLKVNGVKVEYDSSEDVNSAYIVFADNVSIYSGRTLVTFKVNEDKSTLNSIYGGNTMTIVPNTEWFVGSTPSTIDAIDVLKYFCLKYHGNLPSGVHLQPNQITISNSDINPGSSSTIEINAKQFSQIYTPSSTPLTLNFDFVLPAVQTPFSDLQLTATLPTEFKETPNDYELISAIQNANSGSTDPVTQAFCAYDFSQTSIDDLSTYFTIAYPLPGSGVEFSVTLHESFIIDNGSARYEILASDTPITVTGSIAVKYDLSIVCATNLSSYIYDENPDESDITLAVYNLSSALQDITTEAIFEANVDVTDINVDTKTAVISATSSSLLFQGTVGVNWGTQGTNGYSIDGTDWPGYVSGQVSITPTSPSQNGVNGTAKIVSNNNYVAKNLIIPDTVKDANGIYDITEIGNSAFEYTVTMPNRGLSGSLTLPNKCIIIGSKAFNNAYSHWDGSGTLNLGASVTTIKESAFGSCNFIGDLYIPSSVVTIEKSAFSGNRNNNLYFLESTTPINVGQSAFSDNFFTNQLTIDRKINITGYSSFQNMLDLKAITNIGNIIPGEYSGIFSNATSLHSIDLADSQTIGISEFENSGIKMVAMPNSISSIGYRAFSNCTNLKSISFDNIKELKFVGDLGLALPSTFQYAPFFLCPSLVNINFANYDQDFTFDKWSYTTLPTPEQYILESIPAAPFGHVLSDLGVDVLTQLGVINNILPSSGTVSITNSPDLVPADILAQLKEWNLPQDWTVA